MSDEVDRLARLVVGAAATVTMLACGAMCWRRSRPAAVLLLAAGGVSVLWWALYRLGADLVTLTRWLTGRDDSAALTWVNVGQLVLDRTTVGVLLVAAVLVGRRPAEGDAGV